MAKEFNYTGTCVPGQHYMVDTSDKLEQIIALIEKGNYFSLNRPRQYGKSTTMNLLELELEKRGYLPILISFEGIGDAVFESESRFCEIFLKLCAQILNYSEKELAEYLNNAREKVETLENLSEVITDFVITAGKKVVLMIDEVDRSSNNQLFVSFIAMLRDKYLLRNRGKGAAFQSVILAGVHDVKTLKFKLRPEDERKYNSPWNIAIDFTIDLAFSAREIESMLKDFVHERQVKMDIPHIAGLLSFYTSGYPFLVSKLCYIIDAYIKEETTAHEWTDTDVEAAVKHILKESNTNFDSLIKNLENNHELYNLVYEIVITGEEKVYNSDNPQINMGLTYGIFKSNTSALKIHNRIYEQRIYNYMSSKMETSLTTGGYNFRGQFILPGNRLDFKKVLLKFQEFMAEQYSKKDKDFLERNGRLIFLAFVKPIINGNGFDFKEVQISEEKRLDVVITYYQHKYVVELKKWCGPEAHRRGLDQLSDYLQKQGVDEGFLIIYDFRNKKGRQQKEFHSGDKKIFAVWV